MSMGGGIGRRRNAAVSVDVMEIHDQEKLMLLKLTGNEEVKIIGT